MASFFEKNKRKSALALLLLFLKWRKGLAPLLLIVMLLMLMSFAPGNLMGICLAGLSKVPGGAHFAAAVTWTASKAGLEIGGVPHQNSYREYVGAFRLAGDQGFAGLLQKRSFKDLIDAFKAARYDRNAAMALLFHNNPAGAAGAGKGGGASGLNFITGGAEQGSAGDIANKIAQTGGRSVSGVMSPEDAKDAGAGVSLDEADLEGERAGMVRSALGAGLSPDDFLGGSGAFASKAFFAAGGPGAMGQAGAMGPAGQKGANGSKIGRFSNGNSSKGGGARLAQTTRRGGGTMNLGRRGMKYSKALGTLRGMAGVNGEIRNALNSGNMEDASGGAQEQWEGSPLSGSQATTPSTPPDVGSLGGSGQGGFQGIPDNSGGGTYGASGSAPTYVAGDPGLICTSQQLADGMMSDGKNCVPNPANDSSQANQNAEDHFNNSAGDIMKALGLFVAGGILAMIGGTIKNGGGPFAWVGGIFIAAGAIVDAAATVEAVMAIAEAGKLMGQAGGAMDGGILVATAVSELTLGWMGFASGVTGGFAAFDNIFGLIAGIVFALGIFTIGMSQLMGNSNPQAGQVENSVTDEREKEAQLNAQVGGGDTGQAPAPANMHWETLPDGTSHLEYDYNTFQPGQNPPPSVEQDLNSQKGGGDSGLPPAPDGQHYEGVDKNGKPQLVPDYSIGVAARQDANSFTGGPPSKLAPAPSGQHYELINNAGDPTDPKNWALVNNYNIPAKDLQAANANKGQTGSVSMSCGPAQPGYHYEGYNCQQVKDYPVPSN